MEKGGNIYMSYNQSIKEWDGRLQFLETFSNSHKHQTLNIRKFFRDFLKQRKYYLKHLIF